MTVLDPPLADSITVLHTRRRRLAKLIRADGEIVPYDAARIFDLDAVVIDDLAALGRLLTRLLRRLDCAVVRGAISDPARTRGVRRLLHPDPDTGNQATLREVPRRWVALDIDGLRRPDGIEADDLPGCARIAIAGLPEAFQRARCIVQATASHGIAPGAHLRLWYWLSRPAGSVELRRWLRAAPVDHAVLGAAQLIYTAAPNFADGALDPLIERIAVLPGMIEAVGVPPAAALMPPRQPSAAVNGETARTGRYGFAALVLATARVARAADGTRHATLLTEARGLGRLVESGALTARDVTVALSGAAGMAGLDDREAVAAIGWALTHPAGACA
ncbi:MAG: hypothetical protein WA459_22385 [Stellaceae bacterium]